MEPSKTDRAIAAMHAARMRTLMGWTMVKAFPDRSAAKGARHNLGAALADAKFRLPGGWTLDTHETESGLHVLAISNPAGMLAIL